MAPSGAVEVASSLLEPLEGLEPRLSTLPRNELAAVVASVIARMREGVPGHELAAVAERTQAFCRRLYANARSGDALPLARAVLELASRAGDARLEREAATVCGLLSADIGDVVGAIEHHVHALRLAADDRVEASGIWNNLGLAMGIAGNFEMAARCYQRAVDLAEGHLEPVYSRYIANMNLAHARLQSGLVEEGLKSATSALDEETTSFFMRDPHGALILRRNVVRLLVGAGRAREAERHVLDASALAEQIRTPRAQIAAATARAAYELASGSSDMALTRLEKALTSARVVPGALRDTLACVIRAEEEAGNSERALVRLDELSEHVYRSAIERAREHVELATLASAVPSDLDHAQEQVRARLVSKLVPATQPEGWGALERLAVSAVMRMDGTGWHGKRVGALSKVLAIANGMDSLHAMEIGFAAELHDIGMLSVPDEVVATGGEWSEAERRIVLRHVDAGAEMLRDDRHPRTFLAREIVRYHHARWDGAGYPERVGGRFIPLPARICAIADAYDDMVFGLEGRARRTMEEAMAELHRRAGTEFDPELVACFDGAIRAETEDLGMDIASDTGMEAFQELINSLQEDRGYA